MNALRRFPASHLRRAAALAVVALGLVVPSAHASGSAVIRDCTDDGQLSKSYSQKDYAAALKSIPTDVDEYTDCRDVIRRAQLGGAGKKKSSSGTTSGGGSAAGGGGGSSSGGAATGVAAGGGSAPSGAGATPSGTATPPAAAADQALSVASADERNQVADATRGRDAGIDVDGHAMRVADLSSHNPSSLSDVPTPLMIVLVALVLAALGGGAWTLRTRVGPGRRPPSGA